MGKTLKERLEAQMALKNISVAALERQADIKRNVVRNILQEKSKRPNAHNLRAIATVLGCHPRDLMPEEAGASINAPVSLDLFEKAVCALVAEHKKKNLPPPSLEDLLHWVQESYTYAAEKNPPEVDPYFISWLMNRPKGGR
jgi:transcriptional regulator with XRE-family HTH domain